MDNVSTTLQDFSITDNEKTTFYHIVKAMCDKQGWNFDVDVTEKKNEV